MIPSLRPATAALPLLLAALLLPGPRAALRAADDDVEARRATAAELLKSMHLEQAVAAAGKRMLTNLDGMADRMAKQPNLTPDQTAEVQKFREEIHAIVEQQLGWDAIKTDVIQAYADDFSEPELKEMDTFYRTPTGQKLADKQPELSEKMTRVMQQKSMALAPSIRQKIQAVSAKVRPAPPVPPVAPAPSGGPGQSARRHPQRGTSDDRGDPCGHPGFRHDRASRRADAGRATVCHPHSARAIVRHPHSARALSLASFCRAGPRPPYKNGLRPFPCASRRPAGTPPNHSTCGTC